MLTSGCEIACVLLMAASTMLVIHLSGLDSIPNDWTARHP